MKIAFLICPAVVAAYSLPGRSAFFGGNVQPSSPSPTLSDITRAYPSEFDWSSPFVMRVSRRGSKLRGQDFSVSKLNEERKAGSGKKGGTNFVDPNKVSRRVLERGGQERRAFSNLGRLAASEVGAKRSHNNTHIPSRSLSPVKPITHSHAIASVEAFRGEP